jgi:uridine kinase
MNKAYTLHDYCTIGDKELQMIPYINEIIEEGHAADLVLVNEALQERQVAKIADEIANDPEVRIVLIAGPSSSGKTSTSKRLCIQLMANRKHPVALSTDNWFVNRDKTPLDENGKKDYESIYSMDLKQFNDDLNDLIDGKTVDLPFYNFSKGEREYRGEQLTLTEDMILVIEGIHALNPLLTDMVDEDNKFRIYAAPMTPVSMDGEHWIPTSVNRLLRRISRDFQTRGQSAQQTISGWESVRAGEKKWIEPFKKEADAVFDTSMLYELAALKPKALEILKQVPEDSKEYSTVRLLQEFLSWVTPLDITSIPRTSLLREFIGGSLFDVE